MVFTSLEFLLFFPVVTFLYFVLPHRHRWWMLLAASAVFYMAFIPVYILVLFFTIVIDYIAALAIHRSEGRRRRAYLVVSILANIGVLAFFKYFNFAVENVNALIAFAGGATTLPLLKIVLPIGLSFHTFQAMSYTIEVYRGKQAPERHFGIYALFVMFYPQLVAGPIERPQNLLHQFHERHELDVGRAISGLKLMAWGFLKKGVADRLGAGVDSVYLEPTSFAGAALVLATALFSLQIYLDFSGYSDIARGSARVMGFSLMRNFDRPYEARNLSDFWRRWHISLYSWFNDYLYNPLAMALRDWGTVAVVVAVMVTFTLSGLWHGAAWTFIVWGGLHGLGVTSELLTRRWRTRNVRLPPAIGVPLSVCLTFAFVSFTFIWFRATSIGDAVHVVRHLGSSLADLLTLPLRADAAAAVFSGMGFTRADGIVLPLALLVILIIEHVHARRNLTAVLRRGPWFARWSAYYAWGALLAFVFIGGRKSAQPFIYFQF
jgi:D-alanyl-lipoteichoic acid acyltransferase DltB (MBOAT superfamily)